MYRAIALIVLLAAPSAADEIKVVLWNTERLFDLGTVERRTGDLRSFGDAFSDADIIVLDEVTSLKVVNLARIKMGFAEYYAACSDFAQDDHDTFNSLEVGIISRFPLDNVLEYDPSPDNTGREAEPKEKRLVRIDRQGIADVTPSRGFLSVDIRKIGVTVVATHLKSSRGQAGESDHNNARQREFVAASIATYVARRIKNDPTLSVVVTGDMNVGETDTSKNGFHLVEDNYDRAHGDLYDDTHAIFSSGLIDSLHMASLTKGLGTETYASPQFAGVGPIDCLYVVGRQASDFTLATIGKKTFGSDHYPVSTRFLFSGQLPRRPERKVPPQPPKSVVRITALLPNPDGQDEGNEWVTLRNTGRNDVQLVGWSLRDQANNRVALDGTIKPGQELTIRLRKNQMPLNNSGDRIELLDSIGRPVHQISYRANQVVSGREIRFDD